VHAHRAKWKERTGGPRCGISGLARRRGATSKCPLPSTLIVHVATEKATREACVRADQRQDNADHRDMTRVLSTPSRAKILCRLRTAIFDRGRGEGARRDSEEDRESSGHPFIQSNGFTSAPTVVGAPPEGETAAPEESISGQHPVAALVKKREEKRKHRERERGKGRARRCPSRCKSTLSERCSEENLCCLWCRFPGPLSSIVRDPPSEVRTPFGTIIWRYYCTLCRSFTCR